MAEGRVQRRVAGILVADVVGFSRLIETDEEGTRTRIRSLHAEVIDLRIAAVGDTVLSAPHHAFLDLGGLVDRPVTGPRAGGRGRRYNSHKRRKPHRAGRIGIEGFGAVGIGPSVIAVDVVIEPGIPK